MFASGSRPIEVSIRMLDGTTVRGTLVPGKGHTHAQSIQSILASDTQFLEFISRDGQRKFLAKRQIAYVEPVEPLSKPTLAEADDPRFTDAFAVLGLKRDCTFEQAKEAYHRLAKLYHPDTYSGTELPREVERYLSEMSKQINVAFTEVRALFQSAA